MADEARNETSEDDVQGVHPGAKKRAIAPVAKKSRKKREEKKAVSVDITVVTNTKIGKKPTTRKWRPKEFNNRMSLHGLFHLLAKCSDKQRQAVRDIGFGGF